MPRKSIAQTKTETEIKNQELQAQQIQTQAESTAPVFANWWISDLGAEAHTFSKKAGFLTSREENYGYFTSNSAFESYTGENPLYTGHYQASANAGAGRQLINGMKLASLVKQPLQDMLEGSLADVFFIEFGAGGGSSFPFILLMVKIFLELFPKSEESLSFDDFDFDKEIEIQDPMPLLVTTILVPSEKELVPTQNYKLAMEKLPPQIAYQLVKVDDVSKNSLGENSQQENLIAVTDQQARLKKIIWSMTEVCSTQGTNIDFSEIRATLGEGGEIVANEGTGLDMLQALKNFEKNYKMNNAKSSILGSRYILVKFLYPETEYTQGMTNTESQVIQTLNNMSTSIEAPVVKSSIVMGCNVQQPTILILAGGIPSEADRSKITKSQSDTTSNKRRELLTKSFDPKKTIHPVVEMAQRTGKSVNAYNAFMSKSDEAVAKSEKLTESEKEVILSVKGK